MSLNLHGATAPAAAASQSLAPRPVLDAACIADAVAVLGREHALCSQLIYKSANQHRRARPFRAFRSIIKISRALAVLAGRSTDASRAPVLRLELHSLAAAGVVRIVALARVVTEEQVGAGFAGTLTVMVSSVAQMLLQATRIREATAPG